MTTWEPRSYLRYAEVRFRAGLDLISHIPPNDYRTIYDLGCGTGYLTRALAETFPKACVTGIDSSPEMLAEARREFEKSLRPETRRPELQLADIARWKPAKRPDLIFSNAALHWLPNHKALLLRLLKLLRPGGVLAVQMPRHFDSASHIELKKLAQSHEWHAKLEPAAAGRPLLLEPIGAPETYWKWLAPHAASIDIWETIYLLVLGGQDPVVNFMRGTALRPFVSVLPEKQAEKFVRAFAKRMAAAYPKLSTGQTLFPFRRLFLIAQR